MSKYILWWAAIVGKLFVYNTPVTTWQPLIGGGQGKDTLQTTWVVFIGQYLNCFILEESVHRCETSAYGVYYWQYFTSMVFEYFTIGG